MVDFFNVHPEDLGGEIDPIWGNAHIFLNFVVVGDLSVEGLRSHGMKITNTHHHLGEYFLDFFPSIEHANPKQLSVN